MISSTGVPPKANIKEILPAKHWSRLSQNKFKLVYSVWISDGQNYVFSQLSPSQKLQWMGGSVK